MKTSFVAMGEYYNADSHGLIRTVCRGYDYKTKKSMIAYTPVKNGGVVDEILLISEKEFTKIFLS